MPHLLSLLAFDNPNAPVRGLDTFPKADRTPLAPCVRLAFIGMVGIGTGLVATRPLVLAAPPPRQPTGRRTA